MDILGKWGALIFVPQIVLGAIAGALMAYYGDGDPVIFALAVAGVVAMIFIGIAMFVREEVGVAIALSSLAAICAAFCIQSGLMGFAVVIFTFFSIVPAILAAMLTKSYGPPTDETVLRLFFSAQPPIGALMYLVNRLDEEREKIFGK